MIVVAGKSGQVAQSLIEAAQERALALTAMGRPDLDLLDAATTEAALRACTPAAIVNAAAYTAVDQAETDEAMATNINADGAAMLAAIAHDLGVPFIHISTDYVFAGTKNGAYVETDVVGPTGAYGRSKLAGEIAVMNANPNAVILRTAWVFSPFGKNFLKTMVALASRDTLSVVADQFGNPTYAPDIAAAILDVLAALRGALPTPAQAGIYHLAGNGDTSWHGFATEIFDTLGDMDQHIPEVQAITTADYPTPAARPANSRLDCTKIRRTFGIEMPNWRESTRRCIKRLSQMGELG